MSPADARTGVAPSALPATVWSLAGALCAGAAWALGLWLNLHFFGVNPAIIGSDETWPEGARTLVVVATAVGFSVGLCYGLVLGHRGWGFAERVVAVGVWSAGLAVANGLGVMLSVVAVIGTRGWVWPEIASALGFSVMGFLAALGAAGWTRWTAGRSDFGRLVLVGLGWGLGGAVCTGAAWAVGLLVAKHFLQIDATLILGGDSQTLPLVAAGFGAGWGLVVAILACIPVGRRSWLRAERFADMLAWCTGLPLAAAVGGACSVLAVIATRGRVSPEVASSLGFSVAGLLTGVGAYVWSHRNAETEDEATADWDEEAGQAPGPALASVPPEPVPVAPAVLRVLPVWLVSVSALIAGLAMPPSPTAFAFLAVAVLGFVTGATLWSQELRIRELERQLRARRNP